MPYAAGIPDSLRSTLSNDLEPAALDLQPRLRTVLQAGLEYGALGALVSGSGPTCAFLVDGESAAVDLSVSLSAEGLCRAVRRATGPVTGSPGRQLNGRLRQSAIDAVPGEQKPQAPRELIMLYDVQRGEDPVLGGQ